MRGLREQASRETRGGPRDTRRAGRARTRRRSRRRRRRTAPAASRRSPCRVEEQRGVVVGPLVGTVVRRHELDQLRDALEIDRRAASCFAHAADFASLSFSPGRRSRRGTGSRVDLGGCPPADVVGDAVEPAEQLGDVRGVVIRAMRLAVRGREPFATSRREAAAVDGGTRTCAGRVINAYGHARPAPHAAGVLELLPAQQIAFQRMLDTIRRGFERFGFLPVETPVFELTDVLLTKSGGETEKQVYFVQSTGALKQGDDARAGAALRSHRAARALRRAARARAQLPVPALPDPARLSRRARPEGPLPRVLSVRHRRDRQGHAAARVRRRGARR